MERIFEQAELDQLYRSDGVTRRIIDLVPSEMVRQGWEIEGDSDQAVNCKMEEIKTNHNLTTLLRWARLYGGALCVMGIADGLPLDEPVDERNIRDVKWLHVFDPFRSQHSWQFHFFCKQNRPLSFTLVLINTFVFDCHSLFPRTLPFKKF